MGERLGWSAGLLAVLLAAVVVGCGDDDPVITPLDVAESGPDADGYVPTATECQVPVVLSPDVPQDVTTPPEDPQQIDFNCFAWQQLIALSWPADVHARGAPDPEATAAQLGDPGAAGPVVWETWVERDEFITQQLMPSGELVPPLEPERSDFGAPQPLPPACSELGDDSPVLSPTTGVAAVLDETLQAHSMRPIYSANQWGVEGDLGPTRYEVRVNQASFDYLVGHGYNLGIHPTEVTLDFPFGTMEIKPTWMPLTEAQSADPSFTARYHVRHAYAYDELPGTCKVAAHALVGMHVVQKTEYQPNWVWATFEHVDNQPDKDELAAALDGSDGKTWSYLKHDATPPPEDCTACIEAAHGVKPHGVCPDACGDSCMNCYYEGRPTQIFRPYSRDPFAKLVDDQAHALITAANPDSVLQYYRLVNVQWTLPAAECPTDNCGTPIGGDEAEGGPEGFIVPDDAANPVIETYDQLYHEEEPEGSGDWQPHQCLWCHNEAAEKRKTDFSFLIANLPGE